MKKLISIVLAMILLLSLFAPATAVFAAEDNERPTIYVYGGNTEDLFLPDGTMVFPADSPEINIPELILPLVADIALGAVTDDYSKASKIIYDVIMPKISQYALDKNGEASDGSAPIYDAYTQEIPVKTSDYGPEDYRMNYDWRLSPVEVAKQLKVFIDRVIEATGEDKVNLMGRCYGANIILAYLTLYGDHAVEFIDDVMYIAPAIGGLDFVGALFTSDVYFRDDSVNNFLDDYLNSSGIPEDTTLRELLLSLVELLKAFKVLGLTTDLINEFALHCKDDLFPPIVRDGYGRLLSYWSMVPEEQVERAISVVYNGYEEEYAELIAKIRYYHENVQVNAEETMLAMQEKGIDFYVIAKYDVPDYPLYDGSQMMADGFIRTYRQAFGGEYADLGKIFSDEYIEANKDNPYLSPDYKINAEGCMFLDTTWFLRDIPHYYFPDLLNNFAMDIMNNEERVSNGNISRFLVYDNIFTDNEQIVPVEGPNGDTYEDKAIDAVIRFFMAIVRFFVELFQGKYS